MKCPKCHSENTAGARFCSSCAAPLTASDGAPPALTETLETPVEELTRGSLFAGRYEIIEELGRGGMGTVYRAEDRQTKEEIALKLIKPEISTRKKTIERFRNELTTARRIRHKNICGMFDLGEDREKYFITMEYVPGEDLKSFIRRSKRLSIPNLISIAGQISDGLSAAHAQGVVHRDLKPSNIMVDRDGNARIMDFGIARSLETEGITGEGVVIGTPEYMSPEQAEAGDVDMRSDIYSLGVILYEMGTGRLPFSGDTPLSVVMKHKGETPEDPKAFNAQIPEDLNRLILKCLEKDKGKRYQNADELGVELDRIERGIPTSMKEESKLKPTASKEITVSFSLKRYLVPVFVLAVLIITAVLVWKLLPSKGPVSSEVPRPSIAVLPFDDLSPEKDQAFLCDGFSESLINALTMIEGLRVPARTSSFAFRNTEHDLGEIGEKLRVAAVLEGSIQRAGEEMRIIVKLINIADESIQWSEQYNRKLDDVFAVQDEITLKVIDGLKLELGAGEKSGLTVRATTSPEAYQLYLRGKHFRRPETGRDLLNAKSCFEQSIEVDPDYSSAYAELSYVHMLLGFFGIKPRAESSRHAKQAVLKALELNERSAEAHTSLGVILEVFDWDWPGAEREFKRALALNPNHFDARYEYGLLLDRLKRWDEAQAEFEKSLRIDPLSWAAHMNLAAVFRHKGEMEKAEEHYNKGNELEPELPPKEKEIERAQKMIERDGRLPFHLARLAVAFVNSGRDAEIPKLIDELERLFRSSDMGNTALSIARIHLALDDRDKALNWLGRSLERRDPGLITINQVSAWDHFRGDPRFQAVLKEIGLK